MAEESDYIFKGPCEACGSTDACASYTDGHRYCFSCQKWFPAEEGEVTREVPANHNSKLIEGSFKPITSRGIHLETCKKFNYQVAKLKDKPIHIAHYKCTGQEHLSQHIRLADTKDFFWIGDTKRVELFGQHLWKPGGKRLVITEGEIDALTISQVFNLNWPVVSVPSGAQSAEKFITNHLEWCESFHEVVLAFDDDEPGKKAVKECASLFTPGKVKIMSYCGYKDANELYSKRPEDVAKEVFNAKPFRPDGIVCGKDMKEIMGKTLPRGYALPYPELNRKLKGIRKGRLYLFTAGSGIGKSTFVHELGFHLFKVHNQSIGVMAMEENLQQAGSRYIGLELSKRVNLDREGISDEDYWGAFDRTLGTGRLWFYDHFGSSDVDNLLSKIRYMAVGLKVDWLILDHISIVVSGLDTIEESERKTIDRLMTKLRSLVNETGIGVLAIVHLKRPQVGKSYNEGRAVSLTDLRGSGSLEQLTDCVISLERNQQNEEEKNVSQMRLLKDRDVGDTGLADQLYYNPETGRMLAHEATPFGPAADGSGDF
jgi:twinkle protein